MAQGKSMTGTPAMPGKSEEKLEKLKVEIRHTRSAIKDTVESLTERLSPGHIKNEVRGKVREAALGRMKTMAENTEIRAKEAGSSILGAIKENPIPTALAGIGLFLLIRNRAKPRMRYPEEYEQELKEKFAGRAQELGTRTREKAEDVFDKTRRLVERNIWGAGLVALALGMLLGLGIPESERERQVMGGASRKAFLKAREKTAETMEKARKT